MADWFEDESFREALYPVMFPPERFTIAGEQVEKILCLVEFQGRDVLDLCCGPGRHAIPLARRGLAVTAVDRSAFLLAKARTDAEIAGVSIEWVREDMRRFVRPGAYDLVLNFFTSFGYFEDRAEDLRVLENIHRSLRAGGTLVMDLMGKECLARRYQETLSSREADGSLLVQRHELLEDWARVRNEWILIRGETARTFTFDLTLYSAVELKDWLAACGFSSVRIVGDLDGGPYGADAKRLIAVARK